MADKITLELVSPEKVLMSVQADMVVVPGSEGDFGVLAGHAPLMSLIRPGIIEVHQAGHDPKQIFITGGFAEVSLKDITILAEEALPIEELERPMLEKRLKLAEKSRSNIDTDEEIHRVEDIIAVLQDLLRLKN